MSKPQKKYSNLTIREKNFIKGILGISTVQEIDTAILKELKEEIKIL